MRCGLTSSSTKAMRQVADAPSTILLRAVVPSRYANDAFSRRVFSRPSPANHVHERASHKGGRRSAERRVSNRHAALPDVAIRDTSAARATDDPLTRIIRFGRARLPALHRGFRRRANAFDSIKAALHAIEGRRHYPRLWIAFKPSTWLAGRHAGGDDALTARVRSVWLRPQEPPSLPFGEYPRPKGPHIRCARWKSGTYIPVDTVAGDSQRRKKKLLSHSKRGLLSASGVVS